MSKFFKISEGLLVKIDSITAIHKAQKWVYDIHTESKVYSFEVSDDLKDEVTAESLAKAIQGAIHADNVCADYETGLIYYKRIFGK